MVTVTGTLKRGGEPLLVSKDTYVTVTFAPAGDQPGQTYPARFNHTDATFTVTVPPGKYRAALIIVPPGGQPPLRSPMDASETYEIQQNRKIDLDLDRK